MNITIPDLPGTRLVDTPAGRRIDAAARLVIPDAQVCLIHGPIGAGKATELGRALATVDLPITWIDLPAVYTAKDLIRWLYDNITGYPEDLPTRDLQDDLVEALTATPRIVVIRHAERLTKDASGQLQWLHDRPGARWPLFLTGGPGALEATSRDALMRETLAQTVHVPSMTRTDTLDVVPRIHDLLAFAERPLLAEIDDRVCHGLLSRWARFLHIALALCQQIIDAGQPPPPLDRTLARATLAAMPTPGKDPRP